MPERVLVTVHGRNVAGFDAVSGLHRTTGAVVVPGGATPGREELVLERGLTWDVAFARWLEATSRLRRDLGIEVRDESGRTVLAYRVLGAVVVSATVASTPGGGRGERVLERVRLEHRGWERAQAAGEPSEPADPG